MSESIILAYRAVRTNYLQGFGGDCFDDRHSFAVVVVKVFHEALEAVVFVVA